MDCIKAARLVVVMVVVVVPGFVWASSSSDPQRPRYHFLPESGWQNDPNAPVFYKGFYHLFFQYNPEAPVWDSPSWGHAVSKDMVHWRHLPIALRPDSYYDNDGVFSGSATILKPSNDSLLDEIPALLYTGNADSDQTQCLAFPVDPSDPFLVSWRKWPANPIITKPPLGVPLNQFRDPTTGWRSLNGSWLMLVGGELFGQGAALLYESSDFVNWQYLHPLSLGIMPGSDWECPDYFPLILGDEIFWVLKESGDVKSRHDWFLLGKYDRNFEVFVPLEGATPEMYDFGTYYAGKSFYDPQLDRRVLFSWIKEDDEGALRRGWAGVQALPRELRLEVDLSGMPRLLLQPIKELNSLHGSNYSIEIFFVPSDKVLLLPGIEGTQLEVLARFALPDDASIDRLLGRGTLRVERGHSSLDDPTVDNSTQEGSFSFSETEDELSVQLFLDNSVVETFVQNGRARLATRVYPRESSRFVEAFANHCVVTISSLTSWEMNDASLPFLSSSNLP